MEKSKMVLAGLISRFWSSVKRIKEDWADIFIVQVPRVLFFSTVQVHRRTVLQIEKNFFLIYFKSLFLLLSKCAF